jgi:putative membrane protein
MLQHLIVTLIVPPLFISGLPSWLVDWLLQLPLIGPVMRLLTHPFVAFGLFNIVFSLWHVPAFYQAALGRPAIHSLEHILFIGTAMLTWWPIFSTATVRPRLSEPWQMLYLFAQSLIPTVLGAMITFADFALYPFYAAAPRILGLSPIDDQQIAGLLMWMGGTFIVLAVLTARFFTWMERDSDESLAASRA